MEVTYDRNGNPHYTLTEKLPSGGELCFYENVRFTDTGVNGTWKFNNYSAVEGTTKVIDLTGNGIDSIQKLWNHFSWYGNLEFAFTVNPNTMIVDYVYVTTPGFQFTTTVSLSDALVAAGWTFKDGSTVLKYNDDDVVPSTYTIVNKNTKAVAVDYTGFFSVDDTHYANPSFTAMGQADGSIVITYTPGKPDTNNRDAKVVIGAQAATNISFNVGSGVEAYSVSVDAKDLANYVFGTPLKVTVTLKNSDYANNKAYNVSFTNTYETLTAKSPVIPTGSAPASFTVTVYPMINGAYTMQAPTPVTTVID